MSNPSPISDWCSAECGGMADSPRNKELLLIAMGPGSKRNWLESDTKIFQGQVLSGASVPDQWVAYA